MASLSITIPAYNEQATLEEVVGEALAAGRLVTDDYEVLIVDDGSTDETPELADRLAHEHAPVRVLHHPENRGFSGAMLSCMRNAACDYVFLGPADGQADYREVERFWRLIPDNELVFSYRIGRGDRSHRKISSWLWYTGLRILFGQVVPEFSSLFLFRRETLGRLPVHVREDASNFLPVLYLRAKARNIPVGLVGTVQHERRGGLPKGSDRGVIMRTLVEDLKLFWEIRVRGNH
jgi:glycosyltransferase involved in cell wall biosynthesis